MKAEEENEGEEEEELSGKGEAVTFSLEKVNRKWKETSAFDSRFNGMRRNAIFR
jgi:hypothetical protein